MVNRPGVMDSKEPRMSPSEVDPSIVSVTELPWCVAPTRKPLPLLGGWRSSQKQLPRKKRWETHREYIYILYICIDHEQFWVKNLQAFSFWGRKGGRIRICFGFFVLIPCARSVSLLKWDLFAHGHSVIDDSFQADQLTACLINESHCCSRAVEKKNRNLRGSTFLPWKRLHPFFCFSLTT